METFSIPRLDDRLMKQHLDKIVEMDKGILGDPWGADHFLSDLPGKWEFSRLVVTASGRPVAFTVISLKPTGIHIHRTVVKPECRGAGIAAKVWKDAAVLAEQKGVASITTKVHKENIGTVRLVERLGFVVVASSDLYLSFSVPVSEFIAKAGSA